MASLPSCRVYGTSRLSETSLAAHLSQSVRQSFLGRREAFLPLEGDCVFFFQRPRSTRNDARLRNQPTPAPAPSLTHPEAHFRTVYECKQAPRSSSSWPTQLSSTMRPQPQYQRKSVFSMQFDMSALLSFHYSPDRPMEWFQVEPPQGRWREVMPRFLILRRDPSLFK